MSCCRGEASSSVAADVDSAFEYCTHLVPSSQDFNKPIIAQCENTLAMNPFVADKDEELDADDRKDLSKNAFLSRHMPTPEEVEEAAVLALIRVIYIWKNWREEKFDAIYAILYIHVWLVHERIPSGYMNNLSILNAVSVRRFLEPN